MWSEKIPQNRKSPEIDNAYMYVHEYFTSI